LRHDFVANDLDRDRLQRFQLRRRQVEAEVEFPAVLPRRRKSNPRFIPSRDLDDIQIDINQQPAPFIYGEKKAILEGNVV
jgi:hypothetical protein